MKRFLISRLFQGADSLSFYNVTAETDETRYLVSYGIMWSAVGVFGYRHRGDGAEHTLFKMFSRNRPAADAGARADYYRIRLKVHGVDEIISPSVRRLTSTST